MRGWAVCLVIVFGLAGCGDDGGGEDGGGKPDAAKPDKPKKRPAFTEEYLTRISTRTLEGFSGSISRLSGSKLMMLFTSEEKTPGGTSGAACRVIEAGPPERTIALGDIAASSSPVNDQGRISQ